MTAAELVDLLSRAEPGSQVFIGIPQDLNYEPLRSVCVIVNRQVHGGTVMRVFLSEEVFPAEAVDDVVGEM